MPVAQPSEWMLVGAKVKFNQKICSLESVKYGFFRFDVYGKVQDAPRNSSLLTELHFGPV